MRKIFAIIVAGGVLMSSASVAFAANALTEIGNQIEGIFSKLQGSPALEVAACDIPSAPLALGSYSPEVKKLQIWLGQHGYRVVAAGKESQYFGPLTHFALIKFQSATGVRPVSGFYGALTKEAMSKQCEVDEETQKELRAKISVDSPDGAQAPAGSTRVEVLRFDLSGKNTLRSLTVRRYAGGSGSDLKALYLFDGDIRLTPRYAFKSDVDSITFTDLNIAVDGTKTLSVMADISTSGRLRPDGIELVADGVLTLPNEVRGELFERTEDRVGELTVERFGELENPRIGQSAARIAEFRVIPDVREDVMLRSLALTVGGTVDAAQVSNFVLKQRGAVMAVASAVNTRGQIVFRFTNPLLIKVGSRTTFELFADFSGTLEAGKTLSVYVEDPADVYATGVSAGRGVMVEAADYNNTSADGSDVSIVTVNGGVVTYAFRGPSVTSYATKQKDVELIRFDIKTQNTIEVRQMRLTLTAGGTEASGTLMTAGGLCNLAVANYTDVKLVDAATGLALTRPQSVVCATGSQDVAQTLVFADRWQMFAGQTRTVKVTADIADFAPAAGETIKATLLAFERDDIRNLDTADYLDEKEVLPAGNMTGATHRVHANQQAANLANTLAAALSDFSVSAN